MKFSALLIVICCFSLSGKAACPKFVFFCTNPNSCYGTVDLSLSVCSESIREPYTVDYVTWDLGGGIVQTTTGLSLSYNYTSSGDKKISATVYCTVNGVSCAATAFAANGSSLESICAATPSGTQLSVSVFVFDLMLFQSAPTPPTTVYTDVPVTLTANYTGTPTTAQYPSVTTKLYIDGGKMLADNTIDLTQPHTTWTSLPTTVFGPQAITGEGQHVIELQVDNKVCNYLSSMVIEVLDRADKPACSTCFTFKPEPNERYWLSAWVNATVPSPVKTYAGVYVEITYGGNTTVTAILPAGDIIEGWQRIAGEFTVPFSPAPSEIQIHLVNTNASIPAYFDDVRIHPFNASIKTYVNDASTFWLVAELDDNNYATVYEYDKEGKLVRIKKETERGIFTIQESRVSNPKK